MRGVINLRGSVVPVVDLRLAFGLTSTEKTVNTCIVVVEVMLEGETLVLGALADSVEEVIDLEPDQIQPGPRLGTSINTDFIRGMGKRDAHFVMILGHRQGLFQRTAGLAEPGTMSSTLIRTPAAAKNPQANYAQLNERDFNRLRELIYRLAGIHLVPAKRIMVETRAAQAAGGAGACQPIMPTATMSSARREAPN